MEKHSKPKYYNGSTDIEAFLTKRDLNAAIKEYTEEKAQYLASMLSEGHTLNVYMSLSDDNKKNAEDIKKAL